MPANPLSRQWAATGAAVLDAVRRVGESGWYVLGGEVDAFEGALASRLGRRSAVGCASGLDAIEIGLRALGLAAGERVVTTPLSAFATTLAIVRAGGVPVFVDVDDSGLLDLRQVAACLEGTQIRFLVPVHLFGHALDLEALAELKARFDLRIVEDCAQAIGASFEERAVGTVGEVAALSFYPTKNLGALGDGGAVVMDDDALRESCRALRDYGQRSKYVHDRIGLNSRLDELHAAILRTALLPHLDEWTARRRAIAQSYLAGLADHPQITVVPQPRGSRSVWHLFPVRVPAELRSGFSDHMRAAGVHVGLHYPTVIPDQRALAGMPASTWGELREARRLAEEEVSLPIHPCLMDEEIARVIDAVQRWRP